MSIEQTLERIAVALEKIAAQGSPVVAAPAVRTTAVVIAEAPPAAAKIKKDKPATTTAPVSAPVLTSDEDPFAQPGAPEVTFETLTERLTLHAKTFGTPLTIPIMKKHGANEAKPRMDSIPQGNWKALIDEVNADLAKKGK